MQQSMMIHRKPKLIQQPMIKLTKIGIALFQPWTKERSDGTQVRLSTKLFQKVIQVPIELLYKKSMAANNLKLLGNQRTKYAQIAVVSSLKVTKLKNRLYWARINKSNRKMRLLLSQKYQTCNTCHQNSGGELLLFPSEKIKLLKQQTLIWLNKIQFKM